MNYIDVRKFGLATGLTELLLYIGCTLIMLIVGHDGSVKLFNIMLHGLDVSTIMSMDLSPKKELLGMVATFILACLIGLSIGAIYNYAFKQKK